MNEDEKVFNVSVVALLGVFVLSCVLQVCYRAQNRERDRVHRDIVQTQQDIAVAQANFASYVRPESLRNLVTMVDPKAEVISFHKSVEIYELPDKINDK